MAVESAAGRQVEQRWDQEDKGGIRKTREEMTVKPYLQMGIGTVCYQLTGEANSYLAAGKRCRVVGVEVQSS